MSALTRRIARSRLAPAAAFALRARAVSSYDAAVVRSSARWLFTAKEHTNYTYDLTARSNRHLAWWVSSVTGCTPERATGWMRELHEDEQLLAHLGEARRAASRAALAEETVRYGKRAGWYAVVRALRPGLVVETGTDKGLGTSVLAAAVLANGSGRVMTIDVNPDSGELVAGPYAEVTTKIIGDSPAVLTASSDPVDFFLHDSLHTYAHEAAELRAVEPRLSPDAVVLSDNAHDTDALLDWAVATGRRFSYFKETPRDHWFPGEGIGIAFGQTTGPTSSASPDVTTD